MKFQYEEILLEMFLIFSRNYKGTKLSSALLPHTADVYITTIENLGSSIEYRNNYSLIDTCKYVWNKFEDPEGKAEMSKAFTKILVSQIQTL